MLFEARRKDLEYTTEREKPKKGSGLEAGQMPVKKVILNLRGHESAAMTRLLKRYDRLDQLMKAAIEKRDAVNHGLKELGEELFDAEDVVVTRVIDTVSATMMLTASGPRPDKTTVDYEKAFAALAALVPDLEIRVKEIIDRYTSVEKQAPAKTMLKVTGKLNESISVIDLLASTRAFLRDLLSWSSSYDNKLHDLMQKYGIKKARRR